MARLTCPASPAKAGVQIHMLKLAGFIWIPAFAGKTA